MSSEPQMDSHLKPSVYVEVLMGSPEWTSMFMTYHKHTYNALWSHLIYSNCSESYLKQRKVKGCSLESTVSRTAAYQELTAIFSLEKEKPEVSHKQTSTPLCCLKWCILILHTAPWAVWSFAWTLLKLCFTTSELWANVVKNCSTHNLSQGNVFPME